MDASTLTQLGVGGIFAILVIRMVLEFLGRQKRTNGAGERPVEFWQQEHRKNVHEVVQHDIGEPLKRIEAKLDRLLDRRGKA